MARTVASSTMISVGTLAFPVKVTTAVASRQSKGVSFSTVCNQGHPPAKINSVYRCPECASEDKTQFGKGVKNADDSFTLVDPDAIKQASAPPEQLKNQISLAVHPADEVHQHTAPAGSPYWLAPAKGDVGFYDLLATLVADRPDLAFVGVWAVREQPSFYRLTSDGTSLMLQACAWPEDLEAGPSATAKSSPEVCAGFSELLDKLVAPFDPAAYTDERSAALAQAAADGTTVEGIASTVTSLPTAEPVDPLMAALEAARMAAA